MKQWKCSRFAIRDIKTGPNVGQKYISARFVPADLTEGQKNSAIMTGANLERSLIFYPSPQGLQLWSQMMGQPMPTPGNAREVDLHVCTGNFVIYADSFQVEVDEHYRFYQQTYDQTTKRQGMIVHSNFVPIKYKTISIFCETDEFGTAKQNLDSVASRRLASSGITVASYALKHPDEPVPYQNRQLGTPNQAPQQVNQQAPQQVNQQVNQPQMQPVF